MIEVFNRFTFGSDRRMRRDADSREEPDQSDADVSGQDSWPAHEPSESSADGAQAYRPTEEERPTYIRPYAWTGGRTRSNYQLELETLVSTSELCQSSHLERLEHHSVADLCRHPRSVAEVGALLSVPLGVARVLLGDMADLGLITVHRTVSENGSKPHLMLMERVLSGLRRL